MDTLNLDVKQCFSVDHTTLLFFNESCQSSFVGQLAVIEGFLEGFVCSELFEVFELGSIANPAIANLRRDQRSQIRVALQEPSSESDSIGYVREAADNLLVNQCQQKNMKLTRDRKSRRNL